MAAAKTNVLFDRLESDGVFLYEVGFNLLDRAAWPIVINYTSVDRHGFLTPELAREFGQILIDAADEVENPGTHTSHQELLSGLKGRPKGTSAMTNLVHTAKSLVLLFVALAFASSVSAVTPGEHPLLAAQQCTREGDVTFCYRPIYVVDAYSSIEQAEPNYRLLFPSERDFAFELTTNDQTRRALVVYPWDYSVRGDRGFEEGQFIAEFWQNEDAANDRYANLTGDQRAGGFKLHVRLVRGALDVSGVVLVYRQSSCGGR